jgi:glycosyltransferase involved in cell wall biosynthesis
MSTFFFAFPRKAWNFAPSERDPAEFGKSCVMAKLKGVRFAFPPSIVVCFHWGLMPAAVLLKVVFGTRIIYDEHDFYSMNSAEGRRFKARIIPLFIELFNFLLLKYFDLVTCIHMKDSVLYGRLREFNDRVLEVNNYPLKKWEARCFSGEKSGQVCLVYIGGIYDVKGCRSAAAAFLAVGREQTPRHLELHYFGFGDKELIAWLKNKASIYVHENASPSEIRSFLCSRRCLGLLLYENTERYQLIGTNSHKLYEYLASGTPIVAPALGEIGPFLMKNDVGYLLDPDFSVSQLADLFADIVYREGELQRKALNCVRVMQENEMWWEGEWQKIVKTGILEH